MHVLVFAFVVGACIGMFSSARARPKAPQNFTEPHVDRDLVGDVEGTWPAPRAAALDTLWIATWTFDTSDGFPCDFSGWEKVDNHVRNDGSVFWNVDPDFAGRGNIVGRAATVGYSNDPCCVEVGGYDNDWYQAIRIEYEGGSGAQISFDYLLDSEEGFDFLLVESDSACASLERVDYDAAPNASASSFRSIVFSNTGLIGAGKVSNLELEDFGPGTHCAYVAFVSDGGFSPCDGLQPSQIGRALVVDHLVVQDASGVRSEDFEDGDLDIATFVNLHDTQPFGPTQPGYDGSWARAWIHLTDNDVCTENSTCAVLWTDDVTPSIANDPSMAFSPGSFVVKSWLDDSIVSPWVSLAGTPSATKTILQFRRFPGNFFASSRIVQNWSVRGRESRPDGLGGTVECVSDWGNEDAFQALSFFGWVTLTFDMSADVDAGATEIQIRHRTADLRAIRLSTPPSPFVPGPGPYIDRTRIGRIVEPGPVIDEGIDARSQAQDAFPTEIDPGITPGTGEHFRPTTDRFGTTAFSQGADLAVAGISGNLVTGDSIWVQVTDVRGAAIRAISLYGAIVDGPHVGQAPPPHTVGAQGMFEVPVSQCLAPTSLPQPGCGVGCTPNPGVLFVEDFYYVDLDDTYFVGGDVLRYFWLAEDDDGGMTSNPLGLTAVPGSIDAAELATLGLFEVAFLPVVDWDPDYLAAVAANNKVDPHSDPAFLEQTSQRHCILYVNRINARRRSGDINRTSFMYTLDRLGYKFEYDVYDHQGMGNTNNHLGGRATPQQAQGYALVVYDAGNTGPGGTIMPDGSDLDAQKIDQAGWFRSWLAQAAVSEIGTATLWIVGANVLEEKPNNVLYNAGMQVVLDAANQSAGENPDCTGQVAFEFAGSGGATSVDFTTGPRSHYALQGGCPTRRSYDALGAVGDGVEVYRYEHPSTGDPGGAALVMNSSAAARTNTILQSHAWGDVRNPGLPSSPEPEEHLLQSILAAVVPLGCLTGENVVDTGETPEAGAPRRTLLHTNAPNPFNPTTTIRFDLAHGGRVSLRVYDVSGRLVRTLFDEELAAAQGITRVWDGFDDAGRPAPTGVYFYRLQAPGFSDQRKMVLAK